MARGLAVGVFAGCFPLFGLQTVIGVFLAILVRGNKFAAAAGTWVSNPLTYVPLFAFNYKVGQLVLGAGAGEVEQKIGQQDLYSWSSLASLGSDFLLKLLVGCLLVAAVASSLTYFYSLRLIKRWRHHHPKKIGKSRIKSHHES
jgi:uncharacterized protein (DUF2062 family)